MALEFVHQGKRREWARWLGIILSFLGLFEIASGRRRVSLKLGSDTPSEL